MLKTGNSLSCNIYLQGFSAVILSCSMEEMSVPAWKNEKLHSLYYFYRLRDAVKKKSKKSDIVTKVMGYGKNHISYCFERVTK